MAFPARIAITGGSGNLGRAMLPELIASPDVEQVLILDPAPPPAQEKIEHRPIDVRDPALADYLAGIDALVHLAFVIDRRTRDRAEVEAINIAGSINVFDAARAAGVRQIVYTSSIAAYGFHPENEGTFLEESAPIRGNREFAYAWSKAEVERALDAFEAKGDAPIVARLRPSFFLGPNSAKYRQAWLHAPVVPYLAGGRPPVHLTHEDDVAQAALLALLHGARGAFNVAADDPLPIAGWGAAIGRPSLKVPRWALALADRAYARALLERDPIWIRTSSDHPITVSSERIKKELGWRPRYPTTGAVLRAIVGGGAARASRGLKLLFGNFVRITKLRRGLPVDDRQKAELRALHGSLNFLFTGPNESEWHVDFLGDRVGFAEGLDPKAQATVTMDEAVFLDLISGRARWATAQMTGRVRWRGDGNLTLFVGALMERLRAAPSSRGLKTWPQRALVNLALRANRRER